MHFQDSVKKRVSNPPIPDNGRDQNHALRSRMTHEGYLAEGDGGEEAGGAAGDGDREEGGVHGANVGRTRRKQVVRVEVEHHDDAERLLPAQPETGHHVHHLRNTRWYSASQSDALQTWSLRLRC